MMLGYILKLIVLIGIKFLGLICSLLSIHNYFVKPRRCPRITNQTLLYSSSALAEKIRRREITSESVVKAYICRIKEVNPILNAVVEDRFDLAINEAKYIDQMLSNTELDVTELETRYPLLGLPLTVKESIAIEGLSHCAGQFFPDGRKALKDAEVVRLCKESGAIPLLVSNTPELSANFETYNKVTGRTLNPYDTRRTPGGSSGGEAALLSSGASLLGIGSDIFGSLRLPAHYCCIWGHKPTAGIVSVEGHYPSSKNKNSWKEVFNIGPMTRYAVDLPLILVAIAEKDFQPLLRLKEQVNMREIKIHYMENDGGSILTRSVDSEITCAMKKFTEYLRVSYNCKIQKLELPEFKHSPELSFMKIFSLDNVDELFENEGKGSFAKLFRYVTCRSNSVLMPILCGILKWILHFVPQSIIIKSNEDILSFRFKLENILGNNGVLLYPCHPTSSHFHGQTLGKVCDYSYLGIFNCLGVPVTNCPVGLNKKGLPISMQVVGGTNNDRLTLAVARETEKVFGGWIPPPFSEDLSVI